MDNFYDFYEIVKFLEKMSYLNIISFCLLSGCGIRENQPDDSFYEICKETRKDVDDINYANVFFTKALYKNSRPSYISKIDNYYDFQSYLWKDKKTKKIISPMTQSLSISCTNLAVRKIMDNSIEIENKERMVLYLIYSGVKQLDFMFHYLMKDNLLYELKLRKNGNLEIDEDSLHILHQYLGCEAALLTFDLLQRTGYDKYFNLDYRKFFYTLLPDLCHIAIKDAMYLSSRKLSQICDSLITIYNCTDISKELVYITINVLGNEICERTVNGRELLRKPLANKISSFFTICHSLATISKLYGINPIDNYILYCEKLYDSLDSLWSDNHGFYIKNNDKKVQYSIKEIAALISALKYFRIHCNNESSNKSDNIISSCFNSLVLNSGIFISQYYPILASKKMNLPKINNSSKRKPPIFIKKVQYKVERKKFEQFDESFSGDYSLWACKQLL